MTAAARVRGAVRAALAEGIAGGVFPGAVAGVWQGDESMAVIAAGFAQVVPRRVRMRASMVFDLASITKPIATAASVLHLWARGALDIDATVASYLPAFARDGKHVITIRQLLAHASGLPAWHMLYLPGPPGPDARQPACRTLDQAVARIAATAVAARPGVRDEYSDLGFITLGHLVGELAHQTLDAYTAHHIFAPLGMRSTRFRPPAAWRARCVATERGNGFERGRALEQGLGRRFRWRTTVLRGQVHDGNAWYVGGGLAGHAGLFGTVADLIRFGRMMLRGGELDGVTVLPRDVVEHALRDHSPPGAAIRRGLGWVVKRDGDYGGRRASPRSFGHTGFTGTAVLADPARDAGIVLLTNRVHPAVNDAIASYRPRFYDAVFEALDG